jgi:hypothetical protein
MTDDLKRLQQTLSRKHLGKRGIHGLNIDEEARTVEVYMDLDADEDRALKPMKRETGDLKIRTIRNKRARLL